MDKINKLKQKLEELFILEGLTDKVLELSRELDLEIVKLQQEKLNDLKKNKD
ncbi:Spo0E family sporulation regulatory protein-aspartic acid phosphatase [Clostridium sp. DSM 100503]|uniref:Spo0E family sporulation regulatory protein-aspartic acid phosphatase n=1 Tax=Clostridium sp. DSM 100503 TaxID=2963282 RepID=UPI002149C0EB|nr:Spo0E family sporulation regulatory protein-aspartic acid phosphatase [Clostridium sp. DSM 100503]MCR1951324.1 Spo0E family sporulation regulatory protein-aspartic acid phosphatase [Clostridium sp. DSM 100503]